MRQEDDMVEQKQNQGVIEVIYLKGKKWIFNR
jgi:hypothetical protein